MTKISYYSLLLQQSTITQRDFATAMAIFFNSLFFTYPSLKSLSLCFLWLYNDDIGKGVDGRKYGLFWISFDDTSLKEASWMLPMN